MNTQRRKLPNYQLYFIFNFIFILFFFLIFGVCVEVCGVGVVIWSSFAPIWWVTYLLYINQTGCHCKKDPATMIAAQLYSYLASGIPHAENKMINLDIYLCTFLFPRLR